jgi:SHS2 domain-containing protein
MGNLRIALEERREQICESNPRESTYIHQFTDLRIVHQQRTHQIRITGDTLYHRTVHQLTQLLGITHDLEDRLFLTMKKREDDRLLVVEIAAACQRDWYWESSDYLDQA